MANDNDLERLRQIFDDIDKDKSGGLDLNELTQVMHLFSPRKPSKAQMQRIFKAADTDGNGVIDFQEFAAALNKVHLAQEDEWRATFKMLDLDGSGSIDADEFEKACKSLGITLSKTDQAVLMQEFDTNGDNVIDFSEFCQLLRSLG